MHMQLGEWAMTQHPVQSRPSTTPSLRRSSIWLWISASCSMSKDDRLASAKRNPSAWSQDEQLTLQLVGHVHHDELLKMMFSCARDMVKLVKC
jgi:hypothetical protein